MKEGDRVYVSLPSDMTQYNKMVGSVWDGRVYLAPDMYKYDGEECTITQVVHFYDDCRFGDRYVISADGGLYWWDDSILMPARSINLNDIEEVSL